MLSIQVEQTSLRNWLSFSLHTVPTFDNFIQTSSNTTAGTASWILSCYGYRPMVQMTVQWREELDEDDTAGQTDPLSFPAGNIAIFNFEDGSPSNGMTFTHTFVNLLPDTRYAILIRGRNELGTSNTFFIIETGMYTVYITLMIQNAFLGTTFSC